jgi:hypothetical protein
MNKTVVVIKLKRCTHTYGSAPCTASGAANLKCYNCYNTCQDKQNFDKSDTHDLIFVEGGTGTNEFAAYPHIVRDSFRSSPPELKPSGLALRDTASITIADFRDDDRGLDDYRGDRDAGIFNRGTFFQRLTNRYRYELINAEVHVYEGDITTEADLTNEPKLIYLLKSWKMRDGEITIKLADPTSLINKSKTKVVPQTKFKLAQDYPAGITGHIYLDPIEDVPTIDDFGGTHLRINDEIMFFATQEGSGDRRLVGVSRAKFGTAEADHKAGDSVTFCRVFDESITSLKDYILNLVKVKVPVEYIDTTQIDTQFTGLYSEITVRDIRSDDDEELQDLIDEVCAVYRVQIFWNRIVGKVQMRTFQAENITSQYTFDDFNIDEKSLTYHLNDEYRVSQTAIYHEFLDYSEDSDEVTNYANVNGRVDLEAQGGDMYQEPKTKVMYGRFIPQSESSVVPALLSRLATAFRDSLLEVSFTTPLSHVEGRALGDFVTLSCDAFPDEHGYTREIQMQILSIKQDFGKGKAAVRLLENALDNINYATLGTMQIGNTGTGVNTAVMF